jgi:hypothetical protein
MTAPEITNAKPGETRAHFAGRMAARGVAELVAVTGVAFAAGQCLPLLHASLPAASLAQAFGFSAVANAAAIIIRILSAPDLDSTDE